MSKLSTKKAQIIPIDGGYIPTKVSVYLRPYLSNSDDYFALSNSPVLDSLNFSETNRNNTNSKIYPNDVESGHTGLGYLITDSNGDNDYPYISYPIKAGIHGNYDVWIRRKNSSVSFDAFLYLDGELEDSISDPISGSWTWSKGTISIHHDNISNLSLSFTGDEILVDQILVQPEGDPAPTGSLPFSDGSYLTVHCQLYSVDSNLEPIETLAIHDFKTTIDEVKNDGWYNFDTNFITDITITNEFDSDIALVLYISGNNNNNSIFWEENETDEYNFLPTASEI